MKIYTVLQREVIEYDFSDALGPPQHMATFLDATKAAAFVAKQKKDVGPNVNRLWSFSIKEEDVE